MMDHDEYRKNLDLKMVIQTRAKNKSVVPGKAVDWLNTCGRVVSRGVLEGKFAPERFLILG